MRIWPLKFRALTDGLIFSDDAGGWFKSSDKFLDRYANGQLGDGDRAFLLEAGHAFETENDLYHTSFAWRWTARQATLADISYVILVPTLRCNLNCSYCQVSRAHLNAREFDWTEDTLHEVLDFLDSLKARRVKIEFQGGEPTLRLDLLERVRAFCRRRFEVAEFVVCTNLQEMNEPLWSFLDDIDTYISTSIDGPLALQSHQRTMDLDISANFFRNLDRAVARLRPSHLSALPTIDPCNPPEFEELVQIYGRYGIRSIYLRSINYQGFARKRGHNDAETDRWSSLHGAFIEYLIQRNFKSEQIVEEYYFSHALRRVLASGHDGHVDLRNPNLFGSRYIVIDYDGTLYPSDEARMLKRIRQVDLSIGDIATGMDHDRVDELNASSLNNFDPDCIHCPYQAFCGTDVIDDLSRYGRIDIPRQKTWFCQRHLALFDKVFELIYRDDEPTRFSLAKWAGLEAWPRNLARTHQ